MAKQYPSDEAKMYQIKLKGHLDDQWTNWFDGAVIRLNDNDETVLTCSIMDQSALHGLLRKIRDLGIELVSLNRVELDLNEVSSQSQMKCNDNDQQKDEHNDS